MCVCTARVHPYRETGHQRQELKQVKARLEGRKNCELGAVWELIDMCLYEGRHPNRGPAKPTTI